MSRREVPRGALGLALRPDLWPLCLATVAALVRARLRLRRVRAAEFDLARPPDTSEPSQALPAPAARIAWAVPRVARAMPFRADCLVQAMAAERLLAGRGLAGRVHVVVRKTPRGMEAHAWLTHEGLVVTGGEIGGFSRFFDRDATP